MSDTKHTPGKRYVIPATSDRVAGHGYLVQADDGEDGVIVAECDREADAVLDSAAPDLLAASIEAMNAVDGPAGSMWRFRAAQTLMLAAIARATGEPEPRVGIRADEREHARGRLYRAAPDLLAACKYVLDMLKQEFPSNDLRGRETMADKLAGSGGAYALRLVSDAIAKAEGRS